MSTRVDLPRATQVLLALAILGVASGSSSVRSVIEQTRGGLRWGLFLAFCGAAVATALARRPLRLSRTTFAAAAFAALGFLSAAWSVEPRTTVLRAGTIALLVAAAGALASAARVDARVGSLALDGILLGVAAVGVASLLTLAFTHANAIQPATLAYGARFEGYSQNPNTLAMLLAVGIPIALWRAARSRGRARAAAAAAFVLFFGELAATGSRGALVAALAAALVLVAFAPLPKRTRAVLVVAAIVAVAAGAAVSRIPAPATSAPAAAPSRLPRDAELRLPLETEIGAPRPGAPVQKRGLFSSSGRAEAWRGAIRQGDERPVAGYGFGTEGDVFVDRYFGLDSDLTENSYVGLYLQLGLAGLLVFAAVVVLALLEPRRSPLASVCIAVVVAGLVLAVGQSFVYVVGATATIPFWVCALLATASAPRTA